MSCSDRVRLTALLIGLFAAGMAFSAARAGEATRLTDDGRLKRDPRFLKQGSELVYVVEESPILIALMRLDLASHSSVRLFPQAGSSQYEPSFSADGRLIAFVEFRGVTNVKMVIRNLDDNREAIFDPGSDRAHLGNPSVAPDGERILFSMPAQGGQQIVSVNRQGQDRRDLTQGSALNDWPAFSPDGQQIAFGTSRDGNFEIYVMKADGTQVRRLTDHPAADFRPAWSPDGRQIAFTSHRDGNYEIYTVKADGGGLSRLTDHPERDDFAAWHPSGDRIAVVCERAGQFDLYLHTTTPK